MRKLLLTVAFVSAIGFANAQTLTSKNGTPILPESGDWSIGFDAVPVLNYFGNMFNNTVNNSVHMSYQMPMTIVGKYMKDESTAYRGKVRIGYGSVKTDNIILDQTSTANPPGRVTDTRTVSNMNVTLSAGLQKYRGKGRLKGYYGAEAIIMFGSGKTTYDYGNSFTSVYTTPASSVDADFDTPSGMGSNTTGFRTTEMKNGSTFGFGVRGFVGAEYFFAPKMSFSAEYGWGISTYSVGSGSNTTQYWDATSGAAKSASIDTGGNSNFNIDVDNASGSIILSFYF